MNQEAGREIIYARPYNAKAKIIEGWFKRLDLYLFGILPGYSGRDRMNKKTAQVGRLTQPYPHSWERFCEMLAALLVDFNARPIGGQWAGRSADDVYRAHCEAGWRPTLVEPLILDAAFSRRDKRQLDRGGLKIKGVRHHHPALDGARADTVVEIAFSWRRGIDPLFRLPGGSWAYAAPELRYAPEDLEGARESGRRAQRHKAAVRKRAASVPAYDPVEASLEMARRRPAPALPRSASRLGGGAQLIDLASARPRADADVAHRLTEAERRQRREDWETERLEEMYGRPGS